MNCSDFELIAACIAGNRVAGQQAVHDDAVLRARAHAADCNGCSALLAEERALLAGVRTVVADLATQEAPPRLEAALLAAFRLQSRTKVATAARVVPTWMVARTSSMFAAAAAVILAVFVTVAFLHHQPDQLGQDRKNPAGPGASSEHHPDESDRAKMASAAGTQAGDEQIPPHRSQVSRFRKARTEPAEATTDFFPLTDDEDDLTLLESAQVVRVELPASALVAAGLPAGLETEDQTVTADVVLGQDGLARAIRFVR